MYNIHCIHCICTLGVEEVSTGGCRLLFFVVAIFSIFNISKECLFNWAKVKLTLTLNVKSVLGLASELIVIDEC